MPCLASPVACWLVWVGCHAAVPGLPRCSGLRLPTRHLCNRAHGHPPLNEQKILSPKGGFMGMVGERGIGGSKCGSTAAVALVFKGPVRGGRGGARRDTSGPPSAQHLWRAGGRCGVRWRPRSRGACLLRPPNPPLVAPAQSGTSRLLTANSGDARIVLVRGNEVLQLTEDHVPGRHGSSQRRTLGAVGRPSGQPPGTRSATGTCL